MGRILATLTTSGAAAAVAFVVLFWGRLPFRWRRVLAMLTSAAGVAFLVLALNTEGLRESPSMGSFLIGTPYVSGTVSASASLPYYVVTGVLLALGFLGLAAGDDVVSTVSRRYFLNAVVLSWAVTVLRAVLEKAAAPASWAWLVGVIWLAPVIGAYFAVNLRAEGRGFKDLVLQLLGYAFAVRGAVALVMIVTSTFHLGTHYDVSGLSQVDFLGWTYAFEPASVRGMLVITVVSQFLFWPIYTVFSGILGAAIARLLSSAWSERVHPTRSPDGLRPEGS
jgi:hypothetical protein